MRLLVLVLFFVGANAQNLTSIINNLSGGAAPSNSTASSVPAGGTQPNPSAVPPPAAPAVPAPAAPALPVSSAPSVPSTSPSSAAAPAPAPSAPASPPSSPAPAAPAPPPPVPAPPPPTAAGSPGCRSGGAAPGASPSAAAQQPIVGPKARELDNQMTNLRTAIELFQDFQRQYQLTDDNPIIQQMYQLFTPIVQAANNIRQ